MTDSTPPRLHSTTATDVVRRAATDLEQDNPEAAALVKQLALAVEEFGVDAARTALDMVFIATARGKSARNLAVALDMIRHGGDANLFINVEPDRGKKAAVNIRSTGDLGLSELLGNQVIERAG